MEGLSTFWNGPQMLFPPGMIWMTPSQTTWTGDLLLLATDIVVFYAIDPASDGQEEDTEA